MAKQSLPSASRTPKSAPLPSRDSPEKANRPRMRRLIDKDEMEDLVQAAFLAEKSPVEFTDKFCEQHGYTGAAKARVHEQVEHLYGIRLAQRKEKQGK